MRKVIVNNFVTIDGYYEAKDKTIDGFFEHYYEGYSGDQNFDKYNADLLKAADLLILSGQTSFLGNQSYWASVPNDPNATPIRRELAELFLRIDKMVVSDKLTNEELTVWNNTRIVKVADAVKEVTALKQQSGGNILIFLSRILWNHLLEHDLVDELHLTTFPVVAGDGIKLFDSRPRASFKLLSTQTWEGSGNVLVCWQIIPKK